MHIHIHIYILPIFMFGLHEFVVIYAYDSIDPRPD